MQIDFNSNSAMKITIGVYLAIALLSVVVGALLVHGTRTVSVIIGVISLFSVGIEALLLHGTRTVSVIIGAISLLSLVVGALLVHGTRTVSVWCYFLAECGCRSSSGTWY